MAIELSDELIQLQRAANAAREQATAGPYTAAAWRPWLEAVDAVTEHAKATGQNRYEVEMAVKKAAASSRSDSSPPRRARSRRGGTVAQQHPR